MSFRNFAKKHIPRADIPKRPKPVKDPDFVINPVYTIEDLRRYFADPQVRSYPTLTYTGSYSTTAGYTYWDTARGTTV